MYFRASHRNPLGEFTQLIQPLAENQLHLKLLRRYVTIHKGDIFAPYRLFRDKSLQKNDFYFKST